MVQSPQILPQTSCRLDQLNARLTFKNIRWIAHRPERTQGVESMRRFAMLLALVIAIPLVGVQPAHAAEEPGVQYSRTVCYVGETAYQCGLRDLNTAAGDREFSWNTYFSNWLSGPPPGITLIQGKRWSGTFTSATSAGQWYALDVIDLGYRRQMYVAFTVAASRPPVAPVVNSSLSASGSVGTAFSTYTISGTNTPTSYNAVGLPSGLGINTSTGLITGTPSGFGTTNVVISATNAGGTGTATLVITVSKGIQSALSLASTTATYGSALSLVSSGGSGVGSVSFSVTDPGSAGCSLAASTLTSSGGGTCSVRIDKASDANYLAASSPVTTVTFAGRGQLLPVMMTSSSSMTFGLPLTLTASGGSGTGAFSFEVVDPGAANCSILGSQLTTNGDVGTACVVRAKKAADISNLERDSDSQTITVTTRAPQPTLNVVVPSVTYAGRTALTYTGGAGSGEVSYLVTSAGSAGCSITAGELRTTGDVGTTCVIAAYKAANTNYVQASSAEVTVTVTGRAAQLIDFPVPSDREFSGSSVTVVATSDSGLTVSLSSASPLVCSASGLRVTMRLPGTCLLDANQAGDGNYLSAASSRRSFEVTPAIQAVSWSPTRGALSTASPLTMSAALGTDRGVLSYSVIDPGLTNCAIADSSLPIVTFDAAGSCTLQAEAAATITHRAGASVKELVIAPPPALESSSSGGSSGSLSAFAVVKVRSLDPILENGGLAPGSQLVTVDGHVALVRVEANATSTGLDVIGTGWRIAIISHARDGSPRPLEPGGVMAVTAGSTLDVSGFGFDEMSQVRIYLMSRSTHLGSLMTDKFGDFTGTVAVPADATIGPDTLQINGFTPDRSVRSASLGIRVVKAEMSKQVSIGSRIYFGYKSFALTAKAKRSLMAMIAQVPTGQGVSARVTGALRASGATALDRSLAIKRAAVVRRFLKSHGMSGEVTSSVRRVAVRDRYRDRRVEISVRPTN